MTDTQRDTAVTDLTPDADVLVVGAGPTGLMAAVLLARDGVDVQVVDANPEPVAESRALVVQARTVELWHKLGLAETALDQGARLRGAKALLDGRDLAPGRELLDLTAYGRALTPYPEVLVFGQDQTEHLLLDDLARHGRSVERETTVLGLTERTGHVEVRTRDRDGTERTRRPRFVIGADGAHSAVRHAVGARFEGAAHAGSFFLADVAVEWGRGYGDALTVALDGSGGMVLFVPMRDPAGDPHRFRVFGSMGAEYAGRDQVTLADVQRRLDERSGVRSRLHDPRWIAVYRLHSRMTDRFRVGRVFLAGDAAHIHTPTGGQGMNTGLQDAYNLAWKLSAVLRGDARPPLLDSYEAERQPVARALLNGTDRAFSVISANGRGTRLLRPLVARVLPTVLRVPAVGHRIFSTISQIAIRYPASPAVAGEVSAAVGPGDRAPHAALTATPGGRTVFDLLTGTDHHLLVFPGDHRTPGAARRAIDRVVERTRIPIHVHVIDPADRAVHRAYRADRPTLVLVRPDGYIAWRGPLDDTGSLTEYLTRWYRPADVAAPAGGTPTNGTPAPELPRPGSYRIDPTRTTLAVTVDHWFGRGTVHATVPLVHALLTVTDDPQTTSASAVADLTGFSSGNAHRDRTVASSRLLDVAAWPTLTYEATGLRLRDGAWELLGVLTAHGHSQFLALRADHVGTAPDEPDAYVLRCRARLDRRKLGVTGLPGIVGNTVTLDLTLHATPVVAAVETLARRS